VLLLQLPMLLFDVAAVEIIPVKVSAFNLAMSLP